MKLRKFTRLNGSGFGHFEALIAIVVVVMIGIAGIYVSKHNEGHAAVIGPLPSGPCPSSNLGPAGKFSSTGAPCPSVNPPAGPNVFNVVRYGADPSGQQDSDLAIKAAVAAAEAKGGTQIVYFPAGTYILDNNTEPAVQKGAVNDIDISSTNGSVVNILGAGQNVTKVVEEVGNATVVNGQHGPYPNLLRGENVFNFASNTKDFYFAGLTVDAQTYNAGDALDDQGSDSTIENSTFLGSINGRGLTGYSYQTTTWEDTFDIRVVNFCNQNPSKAIYVGNPGHHGSGNNVSRVTLISGGGVGGNDDLDFTCQEGGSIADVTDTGWGTALYIDKNVTINNYNFTPGSDSANSQYFAGFYVTDGQEITINNFTSSGKGGIISSPNYPSSNIRINGEQMSTSKALEVDDAFGVRITNSNIGTLYLRPGGTGASNSVNGQPAGGLHGLTIIGSTIGATVCTPANNSPVTYVTINGKPYTCPH